MKKKDIAPSTWSKDADYQIKYRKGLRYSSNIARRVLAIMKERNEMSQIELAKSIGVTSQYISKLLKGQQNLTLFTIAKLSEYFEQELIQFPNYKYSKKQMEILAEPSYIIIYVTSNVSLLQTSHLDNYINYEMVTSSKEYSTLRIN
jgi:transcriptional regulator with XRE-family HTH domain